MKENIIKFLYYNDEWNIDNDSEEEEPEPEPEYK